MSNNFDKITIGEAFKFNRIVGRVIEVDNKHTQFPRSEYNLVLWGTPLGTTIRTVTRYISRIDNEEDMNTLLNIEKELVEKGITIYQGKLEMT